MQKFKRIVITVLVVVLVVCLSAPCFAVGTAITFGSIWGAAATGYATAHDLGIKSTQSGILNDPYQPLNNQKWRNLHKSNYSAYYNSKTSEEIALLGLVSPDNWDLNYNNTDFYDQTELWSVIENEYQSIIFSTVTFDSKTTAQLDDYYNWLLGTKLGISRDSLTGVYLLPDSSYQVPVSTVQGWTYNNTHILPVPTDINNPYWVTVSPTFKAYVVSGDSPVYVTVEHTGSASSTQPFYVHFNSASPFVINCGSSLPGQSYSSSNDSSQVLPYVVSVNVGAYGMPQYIYAPNLTWPFSDSSVSDYSDDQLLLVTTDGVVDIPDTDDSGYTPVPLPVPWNVPYDPSLDTVIDTAIDQILVNELEAVDEVVDPAPVDNVMPPFLPFNLPDFDFDLSGIWYYVVRWVSSISSGVSLIFNVFANIPPAMFYPVFGSAVVVIVIGIWKRFIA